MFKSCRLKFSRRKVVTLKYLVILAVVTAMYFARSARAEDQCRILGFPPKTSDRALIGHVINSNVVENDGQCKIRCYMENACVSFNIGPVGAGNKLDCELSDSDHIQHPGDLVVKAGFVYQPTEKMCGQSICPNVASCVTYRGISRCVCPLGVTAENCEEDTDECISGSHDCSADAFCNNTVGSFTCSCKRGFAGDGRTCRDTNECATGRHNCHVNATCTNTEGGFNCTCFDYHIGNGTLCLGFPFHWVLNGSDAFISLHSGAAYKNIDGTTALYLDGIDDYAETPALPFQTVSFSLLCWIKVLSFPSTPVIHIYSDWTDPFQFRFGIYYSGGHHSLVANMRSHKNAGLMNIVYFLGGEITLNEWTHAAFTWDRVSRVGTLYTNGTEVAHAQFQDPFQSIDLNPTGHAVFEIGIKRDTGTLLHGYLRDLMVLDRAVSAFELKILLQGP